MIVVLLEHCIIAVKILTAILIKDKPEWVTKEEHDQNKEMDDLYGVLEIKADEFKAKGGKLLSEKINEYKEELIADYANGQQETLED